MTNENIQFYNLKPDGRIRFGTKWAFADQLDPVIIGVGPDCPVCGGPIGRFEWLPPHRIKLSSAKPEKWGDILWGAGFSLMVSDRFKALYESEGLTGIARFYPPAEIVRIGTKKSGDLPAGLPDYHLVQIAWNGANLDDHASGVVRKRLGCDYHRGSLELLKKIVLEPASWNGMDIFEARGLPGEIVVSQRFHALVASYGLKNVWLIPAEKYAYDVHRPGLWYVLD